MVLDGIWLFSGCSPLSTRGLELQVTHDLEVVWHGWECFAKLRVDCPEVCCLDRGQVSIRGGHGAVSEEVHLPCHIRQVLRYRQFWGYGTKGPEPRKEEASSD